MLSVGSVVLLLQKLMRRRKKKVSWEISDVIKLRHKWRLRLRLF